MLPTLLIFGLIIVTLTAVWLYGLVALLRAMLWEFRTRGGGTREERETKDLGFPKPSEFFPSTEEVWSPEVPEPWQTDLEPTLWPPADYYLPGLEKEAEEEDR